METFATAVFVLLVAVAYSPAILTVVGIHNDYELLRLKDLTFWHSEAEQLLRIARPVAALLSNVPVWPMQSLEDYRWSRLFSLATLGVLGWLMITICVRRLRISVAVSLASALAVFMTLPFIYSVLNTAAWAPHLCTVLFAFVAYLQLSKSNVQLLSLAGIELRGSFRQVLPLLLNYGRTGAIWRACLVYQLALYNYPPNALVLALFPVIAVVFSRMQRTLRWLIAARDVAFVFASMMIYGLATKLIYLPLVGLLVSPSMPPDPINNPLMAHIAATYRFGLNLDPLAFVERLVRLLRVTCDLWFLPQLNVHIGAGLILVGALALANVMRRSGSGVGVSGGEVEPSLERLRIRGWASDGAVVVGVVLVCFAIVASPVLVPLGGLVTYRTIAVPIAMTAIIVLFGLFGLTQAFWGAIGSPLISRFRAAEIALLLAVAVASASNWYVNHTTMTLARNELDYFKAIVRIALSSNSKLIVLSDSRSFSLPEDHSIVYDEKGRAIPPYELACLSGVCFQSGAIAHVAAEELGLAKDHFVLFPMRPRDPFSAMTCDQLVAEETTLRPDATDREVSFFRWARSLRPMTCVNYSLRWRDLSLSPGNIPLQ